MSVSDSWPHGVLFDLDGTLVDTAPQIAAALDQLISEERQPVLAYDKIRAAVSAGTSALVHLAFPEATESMRFEYLRARLLRIYFQDHLTQSKLFDGMQQVLARLGSLRLPWGIVTNKIAWLTDPLVQALQFAPEPACVISGDTAARPKPYPDPLLLAAQRLGLEARDCVYIGDARNDIIAANAAGMHCLAATYGYWDYADSPSTWQADGMIDSPLSFDRWLVACRCNSANHGPR